ncbi:hypothetical protein G3N59_25145 [Paraburkholderia sp. Ac-20340]|uniref:hypothetical protein n=1 Tax=Paraburkholderia sp. Ac-20340 TaxID=2703888 RepID=UPI0019800E04|nr:hypothetical protein [Paraburkholderia sp. Ac-20340]MBN3856674.1 hypothetical protein [Paraburkholderia sp. Ac-20340]
MSLTNFERTRAEAANSANEADASLWRWFSQAYEEGRIRWCKSPQGWLVSVDHKHLATESDFDSAIRIACTRYFSGQRKGAQLASSI